MRKKEKLLNYAPMMSYIKKPRFLYNHVYQSYILFLIRELLFNCID